MFGLRNGHRIDKFGQSSPQPLRLWDSIAVCQIIKLTASEVDELKALNFGAFVPYLFLEQSIFFAQ